MVFVLTAASWCNYLWLVHVLLVRMCMNLCTQYQKYPIGSSFFSYSVHPTSTFYCVVCTSTLVLVPIPLLWGLQWCWPEWSTVISGPCWILMMFCFHQSTGRKNPCLKIPIGLNCSAWGGNRVVPQYNDWHARILTVIHSTFVVSANHFIPTQKMSSSSTMSFMC